MRRGVFAAAVLLAVLLGGCRGGGLVFGGTHEQQDAALLERLSERYPESEFRCTGRTEGAVHTVEDGEGTEFPVWTAPKSGGEFQVLEYYLPEWLWGRGYFDRLEERLEEGGFSYSCHDYNHYPRHFEFDFGALDDRGRLEEAAEVLRYAKSEFDGLRQEFEESTGGKDLMLYFHGRFTIAGEERRGVFRISMREGDIRKEEYPFDDYLAQLEEIAEDTGKTPDTD